MPFTLRPLRRFPMPCSTTSNAGPFFTLLLAYLGRFWFLITLLLLSRGPVYAEWVPIETQYQSPGLRTVYVDSATILREGHLVTMVILVDWTSMQGSRKGSSRFLSTKTQKQFDCVNKRLRLLAYTEFLRHMGTGRRNKRVVALSTDLSAEH